MKSTLKKLLWAVAGTALVLSFASCSKKAEAGKAAHKKGTIEFWTVFTGADSEVMQSMVDAYNATNPDYKVNHRAMEANDLYLKLPLAIQSGQDVPDVAINHVERIALFQENGFLTNYNDIIPGTEIKPENYNTKAWSMTDIKGGHYGVPFDFHGWVTYVNMDLYKKYGNGALDDGYLTWDEVKASGKKAAAAGNVGVALTWLRVNFLSAYGQLGGTLTSNGTDPVFTDDNAIKTLNLWTDLRKEGLVQKEGDSGWEMFLAGKVLYCPEGIWCLSQAKKSGINWKMVEYPAWDANHRGQWCSSHQFVIPKNDKRDPDKIRGVLEFINWMGNNALAWSKSGMVPAHVAIKNVAEFKDMPQYFLAEQTDQIKIYGYKYYGYSVEALDTVLPEALYGRMSPKDALMKAQQQTKDKIGSN